MYVEEVIASVNSYIKNKFNKKQNKPMELMK